jgi:fatty acid synthase
LDKLTRISCPDLDYFVLFSSVSCGKGFRSQSNYGYANSVTERICEMRRRDGLHGLAIQWGPIGDVGLLAENEILDKIAGILKQRINLCMDLMDKFLQFPDSIVLSVVSF